MEYQAQTSSVYYVQIPFQKEQVFNLHLSLDKNENIPLLIPHLLKQEGLESTFDFQDSVIPIIRQLDVQAKDLHQEKQQDEEVDQFLLRQLQKFKISQVKSDNVSKEIINQAEQSPFSINDDIKEKKSHRQGSQEDQMNEIENKIRKIRMKKMDHLQDELNKNLKQIIENKKEEWGYISDEQLKEMDRARVLDQSDKDKQLIIERHLKDIQDWMANAQIQITNNRQQLAKHFWNEWEELNLNDNINTQLDEDQLKDSSDCQKIRISQGIVRKVEIDLIIANQTPYHLQYSQIKKLQSMFRSDMTFGMLNFCYFEDNSHQNMEKIHKFLKYSEISQIEDNFPLIITDRQLRKRLIEDNEFVHKTYTTQLKDIIDQLIELNPTLKQFESENQDSNQLPQIFKEGDLLYTQHSNLNIISVLFNGLIHLNNQTSTKPYMQLIYQSLKIANHYGLDALIIPFDFLITIGYSRIEKKAQKFIQKMLTTVKQVAYEMSIDTQTGVRTKTIIFALDQPSVNSSNAEKEAREKLVEIMNRSVLNVFN